jgi:hypothetical protein
VSTLEERVAALELALELVAAPDQIAPNYLTQDPQGNVGADFSGHVHARGLDLDAADPALPTPPDADRLRWLVPSDGSVAATLFAVGDPGGSTALRALEVGAGASIPASKPAKINFLADGSPGGVAEVTVAAFLAQVLLLDDQGQSDFLKLAARSDLKMNAGGAAATWNDVANAYSDPLVVNHGLGRTPGWVAAFSGFNLNGPTDFASFVNATPIAVSSTQVTFEVWARLQPPSVPQSRNVLWLVLG